MPKFSPDIFIRSSVINFSITKAGIENTILQQILNFEEPFLFEKHIESSTGMYRGNKSMLLSEEEILNLITSNKNNLLDDQPLIENLIEIKKNNTVTDQAIF